MPESPILLGVATLPALRSGLYSTLADANDALGNALFMRPRTLAAHPWSAYKPLRAIADMLDRTGWAEAGDPPGVPSNADAIQIATPAEAKLAIDALTTELETKRYQATDLDGTDDHAKLLAAQQNIGRIQRLLAGLEAAATAAGLIHKPAR